MPKQGEIYWYDFGSNAIPGVQAGIHPCVIISNDLFNRFAEIVNVIAVSSKCKLSPVHVDLGDNGQFTGYAMCEQQFTVNKEMLLKYIGTVDIETLENIIRSVIYQIIYKSKSKVGITESRLRRTASLD